MSSAGSMLTPPPMPQASIARIYLNCSQSLDTPQQNLRPAQPGKGVCEKTGIGLAIIAAPQFFSLENPVSPASVPAQGIPLALSAFFRYAPGGFYKAQGLPRPIQIFPGVVSDIPKAVLVQPVEITGLHAAVRLHQVL